MTKTYYMSMSIVLLSQKRISIDEDVLLYD